MTGLDELLSTATRHLPLLASQSDSLSPFTTKTAPSVPLPDPVQPQAPAPPQAPTVAPAPASSPFSAPSPFVMPPPPTGPNPFSVAMGPLMNGGTGGTGTPSLDLNKAVAVRQHQLSSGSSSTPSGGPTMSHSYASLPGLYGHLVDPHGGPSDLRLQAGALNSLKSAGVPLSAILGGSYRTYAQQAANYASDPNRFAPPGQSLHEYGLAIDMNSADIAKYMPRLLNNGWYRERSDEPWHASYGVYTAPNAGSQPRHQPQGQPQGRPGPQTQQPHQVPTTGRSQQPPAKRVRVTGAKVPNLRGI